MVIGILCLQGGVQDHEAALRKLGCGTIQVRTPEQLAAIDGLIIPGGESTTMAKLMTDYGFWEPIRAFGKPIWGTCAGAILLAQPDASQKRLGLLDMTVERNAYGRQAESFETVLDVTGIGEIPAVFIRAPVITRTTADVLARLDGKPVFVRQGRYMATTFHPELTDSTKVHAYFVRIVTAAEMPEYS